MSGSRWVLFLALLLASCAPTVGGFLGEVDLLGVLPGSGTYRGPEPLPQVAESSLEHPDYRVRDEAFALLSSQKRSADASGRGAGPEFMYLYGVYHAASGDYGQAAYYFNSGLRRLAPYAFDRQGRDIWLYGYQRTEAYLQVEPVKAVRDARILVRFAAPPVQGRMPQKLLALELLVKAQVRTGDYGGALDTAQEYFKAWEELKGMLPYVQGFYSFYRVVLERAKALEGLGRLDEARSVYRAILNSPPKVPVESTVLKEAENRLKALGLE